MRSEELTYEQQLGSLCRLYHVRRSTLMRWLKEAGIRRGLGHMTLTDGDLTLLDLVRVQETEKKGKTA